MKRRYLRHKTIKNPLKRAKDRCDDALQDAYRRNYLNEPCESCGKIPFDLMHHHIEKSNSLFARWMQPANLIFLCQKCHNAIHFGNQDPISAYSIKRGEKWKQEMIEMRKQSKPNIGIKSLKVVENYYKTQKPEKYVCIR